MKGFYTKKYIHISHVYWYNRFVNLSALYIPSTYSKFISGCNGVHSRILLIVRISPRYLVTLILSICSNQFNFRLPKPILRWKSIKTTRFMLLKRVEKFGFDFWLSLVWLVIVVVIICIAVLKTLRVGNSWKKKHANYFRLRRLGCQSNKWLLVLEYVDSIKGSFSSFQNGSPIWKLFV